MNISLIDKCFNNIGIIIDNLGEESLIEDYLEDSMSYISFIVEIEQEFDIEVPDEYLLPDRLKTICDILDMINMLRSNK